MAFTNPTSSARYTANGSTTAFPTVFYFLDDSDVSVTLTDLAGNNIPQVLGTNYTIAGEGDPTGGTVTMNVAPPSGYQVTLVRQVPFTQEDSFLTNGKFPSATVERAFDKLTMEVQQVSAQIALTLRAPATDSTGSILPLPSAALRANGVLGFDGQGNPVVTIGGAIGTYRGAYATAQLYNYGDTVLDPATNNVYVVTAQFTSTTLSADVTAGSLLLFLNAAAATAAQVAAAASATAAAGSAASALTQASISTAASLTAFSQASIASAAALTATSQASISSAAALSATASAAALGSAFAACRIDYVSSTQIKLSRYNGVSIGINGTLQTIPSAGVTLANTGLTAATLYYIYAYMSGSTMTLEASATAWALNTTTGMRQKSGDATRTFVGWVYMGAGSPGTFIDSNSQRTVRSYFNPLFKTIQGTSTGSASTTSATFVEMNSASRVGFISDGISGTEIAHAGSNGGAVADILAGVSIGIDGATSIMACEQQISPAAASHSYPHNAIYADTPAEGYHYLTPLAHGNGNGANTISIVAAMVGAVLA